MKLRFLQQKQQTSKKLRTSLIKGVHLVNLLKNQIGKQLPLKGNEKRNSFEDKPLGMVGELPIIEEIKLSDG